MKKITLGLLFCLGLSQVAIAGDVSLTEKEKSKAFAWIKAHPKTTLAIAGAVTAAIGVGGYCVYNMVTAEEFETNDQGAILDKDGKEIGTTKAQYDKMNADEKKNFWEKSKDQLKKIGKISRGFGKTKDAVTKVSSNTKEFFTASNWRWGVPVAVVAVIAAVVIADYATTDQDEQMRITQFWNALLESLKKEKEAA